MVDPVPVRVLVADDQADVLNALRLLLSDEGYDVIEARSPSEALERIEATDVDLALVDLNYTRDTTSGQEGLDLLERIRSIDPTLPVLVITAWSSVAGAVEAMRRGARDYIENPRTTTGCSSPSERRATSDVPFAAVSACRRSMPACSAA